MADVNGQQAQNAGVNPWLIAASVMLATFMEVLDTAIESVAFSGVGELPHSILRKALYRDLGQQARLWAFVDVFRSIALLCIHCVLLVWLFPKVAHGKQPAAAQ
jgi:MFS transporter, DHA2 family, multidrug resistance protein